MYIVCLSLKIIFFICEDCLEKLKKAIVAFYRSWPTVIRVYIQKYIQIYIDCTLWTGLLATILKNKIQILKNTESNELKIIALKIMVKV